MPVVDGMDSDSSSSDESNSEKIDPRDQLAEYNKSLEDKLKEIPKDYKTAAVAEKAAWALEVDDAVVRESERYLCKYIH